MWMKNTRIWLPSQLLVVCILGFGAVALGATNLISATATQTEQAAPESNLPAVSCTASPSTVIPGGLATITTQAMSQQNRRLTYSYRTSSGKVSGSTSSAIFNSTGASPGAIMVTCIVTDDQGHSASDVIRLTVTRGD
jgi:hypothetical protein